MLFILFLNLYLPSLIQLTKGSFGKTKEQIPHGIGGEIFLITVDPAAPEKAGCLENHPTSPSPPSISPVWSFVAVGLTLDSNFLEDRGRGLCTFEWPLVPSTWRHILPVVGVGIQGQRRIATQSPGCSPTACPSWGFSSPHGCFPPPVFQPWSLHAVPVCPVLPPRRLWAEQGGTKSYSARGNQD